MKTPEVSELTSGEELPRAGDGARTGDVQLGKPALAGAGSFVTGIVTVRCGQRLSIGEEGRAAITT
jgi:hypothetical protein